MPKSLKRYYGHGDLHFIIFSCYRRVALLGTVRARNVFIQALAQVREKYGCKLAGYGVMPEHVHLLIGEPKLGNPSIVVHSLKLRVSKRMRRRGKKWGGQATLPFREAELKLPQFWQKRFYDFNGYSAKKRKEKLECMHRNPLTRKVVRDPKDWIWSSYASYSGRGMELISVDYLD